MTTTLETNFREAKQKALARLRELQAEERQVLALVSNLENDIPDLQVGEALGKATAAQVEEAQKKLGAARKRLDEVQTEMDTQNRILDRLDDQEHEIAQESRRRAVAERAPQRKQEHRRVAKALRELLAAVEAQQAGYEEDVRRGARHVGAPTIPPIRHIALAFDPRGNFGGRHIPLRPQQQPFWYASVLEEAAK